MDFRPPDHVLKEMGKFDEQSLPGLFLGYKLPHGGIWNHEYYVAWLKDFEEDTPHVSVYTVREIYRDPKAAFEFPLAEAALKHKRVVRRFKGDKKAYLLGDDYVDPDLTVNADAKHTLDPDSTAKAERIDALFPQGDEDDPPDTGGASSSGGHSGAGGKF